MNKNDCDQTNNCSAIPTREVGMETTGIDRTYNSITNKKDSNYLTGENKSDSLKVKDTVQDAKSLQSTVLNTLEEDELEESINNFLKSVQTDIKVEIDRATNRTIFKIIRKDDQKVIREIPPHEMLEIEANIEKMIGSFLNTNV